MKQLIFLIGITVASVFSVKATNYYAKCAVVGVSDDQRGYCIETVIADENNFFISEGFSYKNFLPGAAMGAPSGNYKNEMLFDRGGSGSEATKFSKLIAGDTQLYKSYACSRDNALKAFSNRHHPGTITGHTFQGIDLQIDARYKSDNKIGLHVQFSDQEKYGEAHLIILNPENVQLQSIPLDITKPQIDSESMALDRDGEYRVTLWIEEQLIATSSIFIKKRL